MIALFDSGLGGLSVMRAVRAVLPDHDLLYLADSAFVPYGPRPVEVVRARSLAIGHALVARGAQVLVVACNAATSAALDALRATLPVPVVGMEPGIKPAASLTRTGRIGVLSTSGTLAGRRFANLVERFGANTEIVTRPAPELVELVEAGDLHGPRAQDLVGRAVGELVEAGVDVLVLGCTHFPPLAPLIAAATGPAVQIVDTGPAVARQVLRVAEASGVLPGRGALQAFTTGDPAVVQPAFERVWGAPVALEHLAI